MKKREDERLGGEEAMRLGMQNAEVRRKLHSAESMVHREMTRSGEGRKTRRCEGEKIRVEKFKSSKFEKVGR